MGLGESIRLAFEGLKANKMRAVLTMLGIIIGIAAVIGILGLSTLVALAGSAEGAGMLYAACILCLISGVLQLIAGIKGAKHCQNPDMAHSCMIWGIVVAVFCVLGNLFYVIGGKGFDVTSLLTGLLLPALYIYGAVLNKKQEDPMEPAI